MSPALRSVNHEAIGVKLNAMFLRTGCILPDGIGLIQRRFGENWMSVENATAATLDFGIRNAGWHFMCLQTAHSRVGIGRTAEAATNKAMALALKQTEGRFNAAELGCGQSYKIPRIVRSESDASYTPDPAACFPWPGRRNGSPSNPGAVSLRLSPGIKTRLQSTSCTRHEPFT